MTTPKKVEFVPPQGFTLPEGTQAGEDFDLVCTFRVKDNKICLVQLGDTKMPGYDKGRESRPDYSEYAKPMMDAAQQQQGSYGTNV